MALPRSRGWDPLVHRARMTAYVATPQAHGKASPSHYSSGNKGDLSSEI